MLKSMGIRVPLAVLAAEALPILALVLIVALFGPGTGDGDQHFAQSTGYWFGPLGGALATILMAFWAVRPLETGHIKYGLLIGFLVALLDASIILASGSPFELLFIFSWIGRVVAGFLGGLIASRMLRQA